MVGQRAVAAVTRGAVVVGTIGPALRKGAADPGERGPARSAGMLLGVVPRVDPGVLGQPRHGRLRPIAAPVQPEEVDPLLLERRVEREVGAQLT